jgi:hypothetical protein
MANSKRISQAIAGTALVLALAALACTSSTAVQEPFATSAAMTIAAQTTVLLRPTSTLPIPPTIDLSSSTPVPSETPVPALSGTPSCTDRASFVADISIPDDTNLPAGGDFVKTWRLKNTGTCTWDTGYSVVFIGGNVLGGPASQALSTDVPPGAALDISLNLKAPVTNGTHRGDWKLRNASGVLFGVGASGPFYVQITVGPTPTPSTSGETFYSFVKHMCDAEWVSGAGTLPCPGTEGDPNGYIRKVENPTFESDKPEDEPALLTQPQAVTDGAISGKFPAIDIKTGYHFKAVIGCLNDSTDCSVKIQLNYRKDGGDLQPLDSWVESYDGEVRKLDVDLSSLAGHSVQIILGVLANGSSSNDAILWLSPRITR